jgi:hypothetical protein
MRAPIHTTVPASLARAGKGIARFLTRHATTGDTGRATDDARQR